MMVLVGAGWIEEGEDEEKESDVEKQNSADGGVDAAGGGVMKVEDPVEEKRLWW